MSIDTFSYPIPPQGVDPKSQRTSLQRGGFASMMDVLTQNETMNQTDNDAFVVPLQEEVIQPTEKTTHVEKTDKVDVAPEVVAVDKEPIAEQNITIEETEPVEPLVAAVPVIPMPESATFVPTLDASSVQLPIVVFNSSPEQSIVEYESIVYIKPLLPSLSHDTSLLTVSFSIE